MQIYLLSSNPKSGGRTGGGWSNCYPDQSFPANNKDLTIVLQPCFVQQQPQTQKKASWAGAWAIWHHPEKLFWEQSRFFCSSKNWKLVQVMQVMQEIQVLYCKSSKRNQSYTSNTINTSYTSNRSNTSNTNNASNITNTSCKYMSKWVNEIYFPTYSETNYYRFLYWPRWIIYFRKTVNSETIIDIKKSYIQYTLNVYKMLKLPKCIYFTLSPQDGTYVIRMQTN